MHIPVQQELLPRSVAVSMVLYRALLALFPPSYEYRDVAEVTFEEQCVEAHAIGFWRLCGI